MPICKICGKEVDFVSQRGNCFTCVGNRMRDNINQLQTKKGKSFEKWQKNIVAAAQEKGQPERRTKKK